MFDLRLRIQEDSPQVKFPPPIAVMQICALAALLNYVLPSVFLPLPLNAFLGWGLMAASFIVIFWAAKIFKKHKTGIPPWTPALVLVREGPYRISRNPIYLGFMIFTLGCIIALNSAVSLLLLIPLFFFLDRYVIRKEENYLLGKFGPSYQEYLNTTRRWL